MELFGQFKVEEKSNIYKYTVGRIIDWKTDEGVLRTVGEHVEEKENKDVEAVSLSGLRIGCFPLLIGKFFQNLTVLTMNGCGLQRISKDDLDGLKNLQQLTLNGNEISSLPNDLFEGTPKIEIISFYGNKIEFIGAKIFDCIPNCVYANFKMNVNLDDCFKLAGNGITLERLKLIIKEKCQRKRFYIIGKSFSEMIGIEKKTWRINESSA